MSRFKVIVCEERPIQVDVSELMTLSDAANRLGISFSTLTGLVQRGKLRRVIDTSEPNPTRTTRVFISDVEAELKRRQSRKHDSRLKKRK